MNPQRDREIARTLGWGDKNFPVLSTWIGMGTLATELDERGILEDMLVSNYRDNWKADHAGFECFTYKMMDPDRFADMVYEELKKEN
jgi:hypothetical protein